METNEKTSTFNSVMKELEIIENKTTREKLLDRIEILDKVKKVILLPYGDSMTTEQVAEYYEVGEKAIETICTRHKDELETDGVSLKSYKEFLNIQNEGLEKNENVESK